LCGIAEEPFWPGANGSCTSRTSDLGCEALETRPGERDRGQQLGVAIARDDLRGDVLAPQAKAREDALLEGRAGGRVGADRPGDRAHLGLRERALQARGVAMRLEGEAGELDAEGRGLGVHAMRAPDGERVRVLARTLDERRHEGAGARDEELADGAQLQR
jgi:hypothetical protein